MIRRPLARALRFVANAFYRAFCQPFFVLAVKLDPPAIAIPPEREELDYDAIFARFNAELAEARRCRDAEHEAREACVDLGAVRAERKARRPDDHQPIHTTRGALRRLVNEMHRDSLNRAPEEQRRRFIRVAPFPEGNPST